jgi:hypothetical protein
VPYVCPVCFYKDLPYPPTDYEICPSCGTEFEYHDARRSHASLRKDWVSNGARWHSGVVHSPVGWNPYLQLIEGGDPTAVPFIVNIRLEFDAVVEQDGLNWCNDRFLVPG